jgi:hypothetical protein
MVTVEPLSSGAYKKATAVLEDAARARLLAPFVSDTAPSSAPPGRADSDDDLVGLVAEYYNGGYDGTDAVGVAEEDTVPRTSEWKWKETLHATLAGAAADVAAARIRDEAERAVRDAAPANAGGGVGVRKRVVERLRARGFNAGDFLLQPTVQFSRNSCCKFFFVIEASLIMNGNILTEK